MRTLFLPNRIEGSSYKGRLITTPALVLLTLFIYLFNTIAGTVPVILASASVSQADLLTLHNEERKKVGLPPLKLNPVLTNSAQQKALAMLESDCWSHYCPDGKSPWDFFNEAGYKYLYAGENLAEGYYNNEDVMVAWMNSTTHKENIVKAEYEEVGFGIVQGTFQGRENNIIIAVHFGTPERVRSATAGAQVSNSLVTPEITAPVNGTSTNEKDIVVSGIAPDASQVTILDDGSEWVVADANEGIFTYKAENVEEKTYTLNAISQVGVRQSLPSDTVTFTVDRTKDPILVDDITPISFDQETEKVMIQVNKLGLSEILFMFGNTAYSATSASDNLWVIEIPIAELQSRGIFSISAKDKAGNLWSGDFSSEYFLVLIDQVDIGNTSTTGISLNTKAQVNLIALLALIFLFALDFILLARTGLTSKGSSSHLHFAILIVVAVVALTGTFSGQINVAGLQL
jgi:uncharacterized protein YkwD